MAGIPCGRKAAAGAPRRERVEGRLCGVGHRADVVDGGAEVLERLHRASAGFGVADVEHGDAEHRLAV
jgi:hypothetical protein